MITHDPPTGTRIFQCICLWNNNFLEVTCKDPTQNTKSHILIQQEIKPNLISWLIPREEAFLTKRDRLKAVIAHKEQEKKNLEQKLKAVHEELFALQIQLTGLP